MQDDKDRKLSDIYKEMTAKRESTLARGRRYSSMTLPSVLPETDNTTGQWDRLDTTQADWQSFGGQAVNNLANRIVMTLFPPSRSFYRLEFTSKNEKLLLADGWDLTELRKRLSLIETDSMKYMDTMVPRDLDIRTAKHLIITGNYLHYYPDRSKPAIGCGIDQFVVDRDTRGTLLTCILEQKKSLSSMPKDVQDKIKATKEGRNLKPNEEVKLYTGAKRIGPNRFKVHQEACGVKLGNEFRVAEANLPFDVLGWNRVDGEDYSRGLVEDHQGDLYVVQMLSEAVAKGMVLMADIKYMVKPGSQTDIDHLVTSPTGEFISGNRDDVGILQLEKYANFDSIQAVLDGYKRQLGAAFLLNSEVRRNAERVTAYEIRKDAAELENSLGGIYSHLSRVWQQPRAHRLLMKALRDDNSTDLRVQDFDPKITTGVEALGRVNELDKIQQFTEMLQLLQAWPQQMLERLDWNKFASKVAAEISLNTDGILMSPEEYQKQVEAQRQQQQEAAMMQAGVKAAPELAKQAMGGQNAG